MLVPKSPKIPGHRVRIEGSQLNLDTQVWKCECGQWESKVPAVGPYGATTAKARLAQVEMAHGKHARAAAKKAAAQGSK